MKKNPGKFKMHPDDRKDQNCMALEPEMTLPAVNRQE